LHDARPQRPIHGWSRRVGIPPTTVVRSTWEASSCAPSNEPSASTFSSAPRSRGVSVRSSLISYDSPPRRASRRSRKNIHVPHTRAVVGTHASPAPNTRSTPSPQMNRAHDPRRAEPFYRAGGFWIRPDSTRRHVVSARRYGSPLLGRESRSDTIVSFAVEGRFGGPSARSLRPPGTRRAKR
jgi:hypothetical protein